MLSGHTIVCGLGQVGYRVVNLLVDLGLEVVVITETARNEWMREVVHRGVKVISGDARDEVLLKEAGLLKARAIIACTSSDVVNIEISLDAKRIRPDMIVVGRLYDQTLARRMEATVGLDRALAMSVIASPAFAAAAMGDHVTAEFAIGDGRYLIVRETVGPDSSLRGQTPNSLSKSAGIATLFVEALDGTLLLEPKGDREFVEGDVVELIGQVGLLGSIGPLRPDRRSRSGATASLTGALRRGLNPVRVGRFIGHVWRNTSIELRAVLTAITALTLISVFVFSYGMNISVENAFYFVITTVTTTGYGDITPKDAALWLKLYGCLLMVLGSAAVATLYSIVTDYIVTARLQQLVGRQDVAEEDHVILAGLGDVGYRTVEEMVKMGARVVVVDLDAQNHHLAAIRPRVPVVIGDAREHETLQRAGIARAASLIAASGDDAVNLSIGLAASAVRPDLRRVLRVFDAGFATKIQGMLEIDVAMSASRIAAPGFVSASLDRSSLAGFIAHGYLFSVATPTAQREANEGVVQSFYVRAGGAGLTRDADGAPPLFVVHARRLTAQR